MAPDSHLIVSIVRLFLIGMFILLPRVLLPIAAGPAQAALITMLYSTTAIFAFLVFRPHIRESINSEFGWCAGVTAVFTLIVALDPALGDLLPYVPKVAFTMLLLAMTVAIATRRISAPVSAALFVLFCLLPVWMAPSVELAGNPGGLTNVVIALSPLTAVAVALDFDYLRSSWFYANSALGSMRYNYPDWLVYCLLLSILPVAAALRGYLRPPAIILFKQFVKRAFP